MNKTRIIMIAAFLLVFAAGVSLGLLINRSKPSSRHFSVLATELNLTPPQREQMEKIWENVMGAVSRDHGQKRAALQQERDKDILSLIPDDQRAKYDLVQQYYSFKMDSLSKERDRAYEQAVEQSKKILTPEQAQKYDVLMKEQRERWREGGHGSHRHAASPASEPTTNPEAAPRSGERPGPEKTQ
jgi:Spy/CpxP family protein refolding chaperone